MPYFTEKLTAKLILCQSFFRYWPIMGFSLESVSFEIKIDLQAQSRLLIVI